MCWIWSKQFITFVIIYFRKRGGQKWIEKSGKPLKVNQTVSEGHQVTGAPRNLVEQFVFQVHLNVLSLESSKKKKTSMGMKLINPPNRKWKIKDVFRKAIINLTPLKSIDLRQRKNLKLKMPMKDEIPLIRISLFLFWHFLNY